MASKKKPIKAGSSPAPEPPRAAPGSFVIQGKAWYDEFGNMVIDEDGEVPDWIEGETFQYENYLYDEYAMRNDGKPRAKAVPLYELKWCPIAKEPKKRQKR